MIPNRINNNTGSTSANSTAATPSCCGISRLFIQLTNAFTPCQVHEAFIVDFLEGSQLIFINFAA